MKTSEKILSLALEVENLCEAMGFDFNESFDQQFGEIRREIEVLETQSFVDFLKSLNDKDLKQALKDATIIVDDLSQELLKKASIDSDIKWKGGKYEDLDPELQEILKPPQDKHNLRRDRK